MATDSSASPPFKHKSQWLLIALLMASSFACVFISAQAALLSKSERVINANILAESGVRYDLDDEKHYGFAPLDSSVISEATLDARGLQITPSTPDENNAPILAVKFPDTATPISPTLPNTPIQTNAPQATQTRLPASDTPIPSTATSVPASETPIPPTSTETSLPTSPPPTWTPIPTTRKPKEPTDTPIPSNTPSVTLTLTPTDTQIFTLTPSVTFTYEPTSTTTPIPLPTDTPIPLPSDTPIPLPSDTPIPDYRHIRPILECVRDNGNGTYTAYFGYNNRNSYDVSISIGRDNGFIPFPVDRGQPTNFSPGRHSPVFDVNFIVAVTWFLDGDFEIAVPGNDCP